MPTLMWFAVGAIAVAFASLVAALFVLRYAVRTSRARMHGAESLLRAAFEASHDAIMIHRIRPDGRPGRFLDVNAETCRRLGYSREELLELTPMDVEAPPAPRPASEILGRVQSNGSAVIETCGKKKNGDTFPVEVSSQLVEFDGEMAIISIARDITERRRWQSAVENAKIEWERTFDAVREMIALIDDDHGIRRANRALADFLSTTPRELVAKRCFQTICSSDSPPPECPHRRTRVDGQLHTTEYTDPRSGARLVLSTTPTDAGSGAPTGTVCVIHDITARWKAEEQLKRTVLDRESLLRELYHRTKNNMQVISSMMSIRRSALDNPADADLLTDLENHIQAMALVHEKLYQAQDLSRLPLQEYVEDLAGLLIGSLDRPEISVDVRGDVPDLSVAIETAVPVGQAVNELLTNAVKHGLPPGHRGRVTVELARSSDQCVEVSITDNGQGLPRDLDPRASTSFGMQLLHGLIEEQLGGTVGFTPGHEGAGTTCSIRFPIGSV